MRKLVFLVFLCLLSSYQLYPQSKNIGKEKERVRKLLTSKIGDLRKEFDEGNFQHAIFSTEPSHLVELDEKFEKYQKTVLEFQKLLSAEESIQEDGGLLNEVGESLYAFRQYYLAEQAFKGARNIYEDHSQSKTVENAQVLNNLSLVYLAQGRYTFAELLADSAMQLREDILPKESSANAMSLNNLGVIYSKLGIFEKAEEFLEEAVRINEKALTKKSVPYLISLNNKAMLFYNRGAFEEAEETQLEALRLTNDLLKEKSLTYTKVLYNLVNMYYDLGKVQDAEVMCLKLIKTAENRNGVGHPDVAPVFDLLGLIYADPSLNKQHLADLTFNKAIALIRKAKGDKDPGLVLPLTHLGNFLRLQQKSEEAELQIGKAYEIATEAYFDINEDFIATESAMGLISWQRKRTNEAGKHLKHAAELSIKNLKTSFGIFSEAEKSKYLRTLNSNVRNFFSFTFKSPKPSPVFLTDAFNFSNALDVNFTHNHRRNLKSLIEGMDAEVIPSFIGWLDLKEQISWLYKQQKYFLLDHSIDIEVQEREADKLYSNFSETYPAITQNYSLKIKEVKDLWQKMDKEEVFVKTTYFPVFNSVITDSVAYAALVLGKEKSQPYLVPLADGSDLEGVYFQNYKKNLRLKNKDEESYKVYWSDIDKVVKDKKIIHLCAEGIYTFININTLVSGGQFLGDLKKIKNYTSFNDYSADGQRTPLKNVTIVAYPDFGPKGIIPKLAGSLTEAENLKTLMEAQGAQIELLSQKNATENKLKENKGFEILHLATHAAITKEKKIREDLSLSPKSSGFFDDVYSTSGIFLAGAERTLNDILEDGLLSSREIIDLKFKKNNLVVLSWVDTWKTDVSYKQLEILLKSFKSAGATEILISLWKTDDAISSEFLTNFYNTYFLTQDVSKAFDVARKMTSLKYNNGYDWGGYLLLK